MTRVGRLAPSPTGGLHLGHARSFLLAWWNARARGGEVRLRIEDLDHTRNRPGMVEESIEILSWLGLDSDGEPLVQSASAEAYERAVESLLASGQAYPCTCSRKEIVAALSAPHAGGELPYPGTCRDRWSSVEEAEAETGGPAGVRFRVPAGAVSWHDERLGDQSHDVQAAVGDFLIARRDGAFAYQLAVVVDDARQGVTEVLRGDDLVASTPRQWLLQEALGLSHPAWVHVPLVLDADGRRLSKRDGALTLAALREAGADPREIVAWAARSSGHAVGSAVRPEELLENFDLARVPTGPIHVDEAGLRADLTGDS